MPATHRSWGTADSRMLLWAGVSWRPCRSLQLYKSADGAKWNKRLIYRRKRQKDTTPSRPLIRAHRDGWWAGEPVTKVGRSPQRLSGAGAQGGWHRHKARPTGHGNWPPLHEQRQSLLVTAGTLPSTWRNKDLIFWRPSSSHLKSALWIKLLNSIKH